MSNFIEMNDTANKKLLDHVRRKHSKGSVSLKKLQLVKSLGSQERMIDSLTSLNVGTAYTISSLTELIDEKRQGESDARHAFVANFITLRTNNF